MIYLRSLGWRRVKTVEGVESMACMCGQDRENLQKYLQPLHQILSRYAGEERYLVPILQEAQEAYGYLPREVLREVARKLNISFSKVYGVATFYAQFHLQPRGRHVIKVCTGTACHVRGGGEVLKAFQKELGITPGQTTADLEFTLETVACIGACGLAPVIMVDEDTHGRVSPESVKGILDSYRKGTETEVAAG